MMINLLKSILIIISLICSNVFGQTINRYGTTAANFLEIGVGSRLPPWEMRMWLLQMMFHPYIGILLDFQMSPTLQHCSWFNLGWWILTCCLQVVP